MTEYISNDNLEHIIGLPCIREEDYLSFLSAIKHPDDLPRTWEGFVKRTKKSENDYGTTHIIKHIDIDFDAFTKWCRIKLKNVSYDAMFEFSALREEKSGKRG